MEYALQAEPTHSVWDRDLPPRLVIRSGDTVHFACQDASGGQVSPGMSLESFLGIDTTRIHALTGPVMIDGAMPGDVLEVRVRRTQHHGWGWSSILRNLGFLKDRFCEPYLFHWELEGDASFSLAPARVPLRPFLGVMGVARAEAGRFRTRPPGSFGGNLDVRELCAGARLYLPVQVPGALFSCGDGHAAQGDGEVCGTALESPMRTALRFDLIKQQPLAFPRLITPGPVTRHLDQRGYLTSTGIGPDLMVAARDAVRSMIDWLMREHGMPAIDAYMLCSVCGDLRISEIVDMPNWIVSFYFPRCVFD